MKNLDRFQTKDQAFSQYSKIENLYNVHTGVSAGRFIDWLFSEYDQESEEENIKENKSSNDKEIIGELKKQSLLDDCRNMAETLRKIDQELRIYGLRGEEIQNLLYKNLCSLMYQSDFCFNKPEYS